MTEELDLKDILRIVRRRFWLICIIMIAVIGATAVVSYYLLTPIYDASTKLIVNKGADQSGETQSPDLNDINANIRLISTYKEIIQSNAIMNEVVNQYPHFGLSEQQLIRKVQVSSVNNSQVMTVTVQDPSYSRAAEIANAVSIVFKEEIPAIFNVDNVTILNQADPHQSASPLKPNPILNMAIAFVTSLMIGVGLAFLLEYLDDSIKTEEDVQKTLGLPTLAMVERLKDNELSKEHRFNRSVAKSSPVIERKPTIAKMEERTWPDQLINKNM